jgi:hypothetical protein
MRGRTATLLVAFAVGTSLALGAAAPASAAEVGYADPRTYQQTVPPDVINQPGMSPAEQTAWRDITRNYNGAPAGTPSEVAVPVGSKEKTAWNKAGGAVGGALFVMPVVGLVGNALTNGYFENQAQENCKTPGWFGGLTQFAGELMGFGCEVPDDEDLPVAEGFEPPVWAEAGGVAGFPWTTPGATATFRAPFWSNVRTSATGGANATGAYVEGWVYPLVMSSSTGLLRAGYIEYGPSGETYSSGVEAVNQGTADIWAATPETRGLPQCIGGGVLCVSASKIGTAIGTGRPVVLGSAGSTLQNQAPAPLPPQPQRIRTYTPNTVPPAPTTGQSTEIQTIWKDDQGRTSSCTTTTFMPETGVIPRPCSPILPPDWGITTGTTIQMQPVGRPAEAVPLQNFEVDPRVIDWQKTYPQCSTQICLLELYSVEKGDCFALGSECAGWHTDPNKADRYRCTYAGVARALSDCDAYAPIFTPGRLESGTGYAPVPGATPGGATSMPPRIPETSPVPGADNETGECFPSGWGLLNPVEWVVKPIKCAMTWAFVPRQSVVRDKTEAMSEAWKSSSLIRVTDVLVGGQQLLLSSGSCEGPAVNINVYGATYSGHPLSACSGAPATIAALTKLFTTIGIWIVCAVSCTRSVGGVFEFPQIGGSSS